MTIARPAVVTLATLLLAGVAAAQPTLTGMAKFSTDGSGSAAGGNVWNTLGADGGIWNLYVIPGPPGGAFVNAGDGPGTSISMPLAVGTNTFTLHAEYSGPFTYMGLNLFFDGDNANPRISVYGSNGSTGGTATAGTTYRVDGTQVPGAGTDTFTVGGYYRVTLSSYLYSNGQGVDRVADLNDVPSQVPDNTVTFVLEVEELRNVPMLSSAAAAALALLLAAAAFVALRRLA